MAKIEFTHFLVEPVIINTKEVIDATLISKDQVGFLIRMHWDILWAEVGMTGADRANESVRFCRWVEAGGSHWHSTLINVKKVNLQKVGEV